MALTRITPDLVDSTTAYFNDPLIVLHQGATQANVDVGFLLNRANGLVSNVALYWSENTQSFVTAFTGNSGANNGNISVTSYANLTVGNIVATAISVNGADFAANAASLQNQIIGANAAIVTANSAVVSYVNTLNNAITSNVGSYYVWANANTAGLYNSILGANAAIVTANSAVVSYVNSLNTVTIANTAGLYNSILGANAAIVTANSAVVSYVNSLNTSMNANVAGANAAIVTANSAVVSYVNTLNSVMSSNVAGANAAIVTANTALKAYVDAANTIQSGRITTLQGQVYTNANVAAYLPTYTGSLGTVVTTSGNLTVGGNLYVSGNSATVTALTASGNVAFIGNSSVGAATPTTILLQGQLQPYTAYSPSNDVYTNTVLTLPDANWQIIEAKGTAIRSVFSRNSYGDLNIGQNYTGYIGSIQINAGSASTSQVKFVTGSTGQYLSNFDNAGNLNVAGNAIINGGQLTVGNLSVTSAAYLGSVYDNGVRVVSTSSGAGNLTISGAGINLTATGPGATTVGSGTSIPVITTDAYGRIIGLTSSAVSATINTTGTTGSGSVSNGGTLAFTSTNGVLVAASGGTVSISTPQNLQTAASPTFAGLTTNGTTQVNGTLGVTGVATITNSTISSGTGSGALVVTGGIGAGATSYFGGDLYVTGNIFTPNLVATNSTTLNTTSPMAYFQVTPTYPYNFDTGFYSHFVGGPANVYAHTGFVRNHNTNYWTFFSNVKSEPTTTTINFADTGIIYDTIYAGGAIFANNTQSTSTTTGAVTVTGGMGIGGNLNVNSAGYFGYNASSAPLLNPSIIGTSSSQAVNAGQYYVQTALINTNGTGSSDIVAYPNNTTDGSTGFMDMGFTGNLFSDPSYTITKANDGYLFASALKGAGLGGNLVLATDSTGTYGDIIFATNSFYANAEVARFHGNASNGGYLQLSTGTASTSTTTGALRVSGGVGVTGNIVASTLISTGNVVAANVVASSVYASSIYSAGNVSVGGATPALVTAPGSNSNLTIDPDGSGNVYLSANTFIQYTTPATSTTTGAFVVSGGAGIVGNVFAGNVLTSGLYWSGNGNVFQTSTYTAASAPPTTGNLKGDQWYNTITDTLYEYISDGTSLYWVDTTTPLVTVNPNSAITTSQITTVYLPVTATGAALTVIAANTQGGTGYADFIKITNTATGATNPSKTLRLDSSGTLQVINNAYTTQLFSITDVGDVSSSGVISAGTQLQVAGKQAVNGPAFAYGQDPGAASQTITSGSLQKVTFTLKDYDTNNNFASSRFTPTVAGYYQFNSTVRMDNGGPGTGECMIVLYKNGSEYHRGWNSTGTDFASGGWWSMSVTAQAYANGTTDYFEIYVQQTSGSNRSVTRGANLSWFNGCMLRGA
jgi:hypothetical protein